MARQVCSPHCGRAPNASAGAARASKQRGYSAPMALPRGLYDLLLTEGLAEQLGQRSPLRALVEPLGADAAQALAEHLAHTLSALLDELQQGGGADAALRQLELANELLVWLRQRQVQGGAGQPKDAPSANTAPELLAPPPRRLLSIHHPAEPAPLAPELGLRAPWLFTAGRASPSLLQELRRELASCERVDVLVSFITVSGVRKLRDVLQQITARGAAADAAAGPRIRILTTTYTGATEAAALDELARLPGCELRVSLDGRRTRLHAKAWMFHRTSGFGSAYVGSANLSGAALTGGLEWTVKLTQRGQAALFARAAAHFETLWDDDEFERYDPDDAQHRHALAAALGREAGHERVLALPSFFELQPKAYQQQMLEQLAAERARGRRRNLLVAATGTGKTMVAAFDYRRVCAELGGRPRLLFVAHREEILRQALRCYREVLREPDFGALYTGSERPERIEHLFATIDSLTSRALVAEAGAGYWHTVVVDECHRLAAERFDAFARRVQPALFLGLTATPERSDGRPLAPYFDMRPDGGPAVELRLWHALDLQLLAPFEYYACDDPTDFSSVPWDQAGEREALERLVGANTVRAQLVVREWQRLAAAPHRAKALVFCVSVAHAEFMAAMLNRCGLPAACVVGSTPADERRQAPQRLARGELCALVTVDLYNEGVDLPQVDTLLLLRPTQSPVLFQQQLGRGLRLAPGKEACLVLDFVGQHRADFRFDRLLTSITGLARRALADAVEHGFGSLPPGCHIQLQPQTRAQVLGQLRARTEQGWRQLRAELQSYAALRGRSALRLADFLHDQALDLGDVYRDAQGRSGWTALRRDAGLLLACEPGPEEAYFSRRAASLLHWDDTPRLRWLAALPQRIERGDAAADRHDRLLLQMLAYQIDGQHGQTGDGAALLARLARHAPVVEELAELAALLDGATPEPLQQPLPGLEDTPLVLHARYGIRELLTAVGWLTPTRRTPLQAGVLALPGRRVELLFVTLDKREGYHASIAYHDYAISRTRFHWQSQNSAGPDTPAGRRYLHGAAEGWSFQLFVRKTKGETYHACGPVTLEQAEGSKPMSITWRLAQPLPARLFREFSVLRDA
jgi:superfamily II DNA or RNA helicase